MEVSAADFAQNIAQPACKEPSPNLPAYHTPPPGINVSSSLDEPQCCCDPEPDIALAYTVVEPNRSGNLVMLAAAALGVEAGRQCHDLKDGLSVVTASGATVHPEQVC